MNCDDPARPKSPDGTAGAAQTENRVCGRMGDLVDPAPVLDGGTRVQTDPAGARPTKKRPRR